jgi:hypothetical protein
MIKKWVKAILIDNQHWSIKRNAAQNTRDYYKKHHKMENITIQMKIILYWKKKAKKTFIKLKY